MVGNAAPSTEVTLPTVGKVEVQAVPGWRNWRTLIINAAMVVAVAAGGPLLDWLGGVDWTQYVDPKYAFLFQIAVNVALRFITKGPAMSNVIVRTPPK